MGFLSRFHKPSADDPPPTESWPLFAFGKLPVYKDFISAGLTDDASREFRDWLSNGFSRLWSSRDDCRSAEIPLHAFLLRLPQSRKMAAGALWGSTDQGGLRKFPFALFTILPAGKPAASALTALDYLPVFENRAREIRRRYDAEGSLAAVYQELRGARIEIPLRTPEQIRARLAEALARARVGLLATALFGSDAETRWAALLTGLDAAARSPTAGAAAFRIPLADETAPLHQMKLWTVRFTKASPAGAPTGVLYRTGGEAPCGVIFFRDARAEDILLFHPAAIPTDFIEEIPKPDATKPAPAEAAPPVEPGPPAEKAPPPEAAPPPEPPPAEEVLLLGAAAPVAELLPASPPAASAAEATPDAPTPSEEPAVPQTPAVGAPLAAPAPAAPAADASPPAPPPPMPSPRVEPAGWDLPLASLLEPG